MIGGKTGMGFLQRSGERGWLIYEFKVYMGYLRENTQKVGLKIKELQYRHRILENKIQLKILIKIKHI